MAAASTPLLLFLFHLAYAQWLVPETCVAPDSFARVNPGADIVIGAILRVHKEGEGVYGCGRTNVEGLEVYEAMRWAISILNQRSGEVNGRAVTDSFIPGVQLGLQVYDSCSHQDVATAHVTNLFPILKSGSMTCRPENTSLLAGLIDMEDVERNNLLIENLRRYTVPVVPIRLGSLVPAEQLATVLAEIAHDLEWEKLAIIHADDEHSVHTTKQFGQIARGGKPCIVAVHSVPSSDAADAKLYRKIFSHVTNRLDNNTGIIVIANGPSIPRLMQVMLENTETTRRLQWLFSWVPPEEELSRMPNGTHLYGVTPFPDHIRAFEDYWEALKSVSSASSLEDRWFLSYLSSMRCRPPGQSNSNLPLCPSSSEAPFSRLTRTSRSLAAVHAVFTFAHALRNSWETICGSIPGVCSGLRQMSRHQFVKEFLEPLEFRHDVANRSPPEINGRRAASGRDGEMAGIKLALAVYDATFGPNLIYRQAIAYDTKAAEVIDVNVKYIPSLCPRKGCTDCVRVRQSRVELDGMSDEEIVSIGKSDAIMIPILLPIHEQGSHPLECGPKINSHAIQDLEAALWTIDMINSDPKFLPGIRLGASVIDTCSSPVKVREKLAKFLARHSEDAESVDIDVALAVMTSASAEEAAAATSMLSPFNISLVSAHDMGLPKDQLGIKNYLFQIEQPLSVRTTAMVEVLKYLGWSYVSVLFDSEARNVDAAGQFRKLAVKEGICLAFDANVEGNDSIAFGLAKAWKSGARGVVTFLSESSTQFVLADLRQSGDFSIGDIMWIANSHWVVEDADEFASGTLFFEPQRVQLKGYVNYFQNLKPENNKRNPWFAEYWKQQLGCTDSRCGPLQFYRTSDPFYSSQAILAMAAGFARLAQQVCLSEKGLCTKLAGSSQLRPAISNYIQFTASGIPEDSNNLFSFTSMGYGDLPFDVYFYHSAVNGLEYKKVGIYHTGYLNMSKLEMYGRAGEDIRFDDKRSECASDCGHCAKQDWLITNSPDNLYIVATMNVHDSTKHPLQCGPLSTFGIQKVEAFLWALDQLNSHPSILPGVQVGGVILDVCSSREKTARDISNFFSHSFPSISSDIKPPLANQVIGVVAGESSHEVSRVVDVTMPLKVTTVTPVAASSNFNELDRYEYLLRLSPPNDIMIDGLVSVLKHFQWSYVSVIYEEDHMDAYQIFKRMVKFRGIIIGLDEKLTTFSHSETKGLLSRLNWKMADGARIVILFLSTSGTDHLLGLAEQLPTFGKPIWMTLNNIDVFYRHPQVSLGAISIRTTSFLVPSFMDHFVHLSLVNNTRNPWFREYWETMFKCRGASCYNSSSDVNRQRTFLQDPQVPGIINGVFALGYGLEKARQTLCQSKVRGLCPQMRGVEELRPILKESVRQQTFTGADGKVVRFRNKGYSPGWYDIYSFMQVGSNAQAFVSIGRFSEEEGVQMNASRSRGYDENGRQLSLYKIQSVCNNTDDCSFKKREEVRVMETKSDYEFAILASLPVHHTGKNFFDCGSLNTDSIFQNLAALAFAVDKINRNQSILSETKLGLVAFDYCDRNERAEQQIYSYYSDPSENIATKPKSVVAALTYSTEVANRIAPTLRALEVAQIIIPATPEIHSKTTVPVGFVTTSPSAFTKLRVAVDILKHFKWRSIFLMYSKDNFGRAAYKKFTELAERHICLIGVLDVDVQESDESMARLLQKKVTGQTGVVVLLSEDVGLVKQLMKALESHHELAKSQWIVTGEYTDEPIHHGTIFIRTDSKEVSEFKGYLSRLTPGKHDPIPDLWFDEFWQNHFKCSLIYSKAKQTQYQTECRGDEKIDPNSIDQAKFVSHTVYSVNAIAKGLQNYLRKHCLWAGASVGIDDCGSEARTQLSEEIMNEAVGPFVCSECGPRNTAFGYQIYQATQINGSGGKLTQVGYWKDDWLEIQKEDIIVKPNLSASCISDKAPLVDTRQNAASRSLSLANFKTLWGIILTALSILGIVLVIICALYFLISFPVTVGTTVLGYMILVGLLMLYTVNFAFIVTPTDVTCGIRRFTLGLAYSVIFAGLLVKVINMWRMMGYHGNRMMEDGTKLSSPAGLLVIAVGMVIIQVILAAAWLVLMPPKVGKYGSFWRCSPPSTSEEELVISLVYVMLLLALTIIFASLTWKCQDNNRESRWILACCIFVTGIWIAWTILWTHMPVNYRDATTVIANLICATAVMVFLYLRKVYIYSKLTSQARDREMTASLQPSSYAPSLYGTLHKSNLTAMLYGSQASLNGKLYSGGNRSRSAWFTDDAKSDSSGSVQVQATDLYPLDMYDGGSQFQPGNPIYGSKHLVMMDDSIPFTR